MLRERSYLVLSSPIDADILYIRNLAIPAYIISLSLCPNTCRMVSATPSLHVDTSHRTDCSSPVIAHPLPPVAPHRVVNDVMSTGRLHSQSKMSALCFPLPLHLLIASLTSVRIAHSLVTGLKHRRLPSSSASTGKLLIPLELRINSDSRRSVCPCSPLSEASTVSVSS